MNRNGRALYTGWQTMLQQDDMSHYLRDKALEKRLAAQQARVNCTFV